MGGRRCGPGRPEAWGRGLQFPHACAAQAWDPGHTTLFVTGAGIRKITLEFAESPDPNVGFDDLSFCLHEDTVPVDGVTWSSVKSRFDR